MRKCGAEARPENYSLLTTNAFNYRSIHSTSREAGREARGVDVVVVLCDSQVDNDNIYMSRLGQINLLMSWLLDLIHSLSPSPPYPLIPCYGCGGYARTICLHVYCPDKQWRYLLSVDLWWWCYRISTAGKDGQTNRWELGLIAITHVSAV